MREANSQRFFLDGEWRGGGGGGEYRSIRVDFPRKKRSEMRAKMDWRRDDRSSRYRVASSFLPRSIGSRSKFRGEGQSLTAKDLDPRIQASLPLPPLLPDTFRRFFFFSQTMIDPRFVSFSSIRDMRDSTVVVQRARVRVNGRRA